jgi:hypothetical protein
MIDSLSVDNSDEVIAEYIEWLRKGIDEALTGLENQCQDVDATIEAEKTECRGEIDAVFVRLQEQYVTELAEKIEDRDAELLFEDRRLTASYRKGAAEAQRLAGDNQVNAAKNALKTAERMLKQEREERKEAIISKYKKIEQVLCDRLKRELGILQTKLEMILAEKELKQRKLRKGIEQRTAVFIQSELRRAIVGACETLQRASLRGKATNILTSFAVNYLQENEMAFLLNID